MLAGLFRPVGLLAVLVGVWCAPGVSTMAVAQDSIATIVHSSACATFAIPMIGRGDEVVTIDYVVTFGAPTLINGLAIDENGLSVRGKFEFASKKPQTIAIWGSPRSLPKLVFTTMGGDPVRFIAAEGDGRTRVTQRTTFGYLHELPADAFRAIGAVHCVPDPRRPGQMMAKDEGDDLVEDLPPGLFGGGTRKSLNDVFPMPAPERPKSLEDSLSEVSKPREEKPKLADGFAVAAESERPDRPAPEAAAEPTITPAVPSASLAACVVANDQGVSFPINDVAGASSYTVGLRNSAASALAFDYDRVSGLAFPTEIELDLSDSSGQTVSYRPVGSVQTDTAATAIVPVTVQGMDLTRAKAKPVDAASEGPRPLFRIAVFGAPNEIILSGLDQLEQAARGNMPAVDMEYVWHRIGPTGKVSAGVSYSSLIELVSAAFSLVSGEPDMASLSEDEFEALLKQVESVILASPAIFNRVIMVKGAYQVPASTPVMLESMVRTINDSDRVAKGPTGKQTRWLWIITARMPGFGVAYLKQPLANLESGDVIDEPADNPTSPRRLIVDIKTWAAKLVAAAQLLAGPATPREPAASAAGINDTLAVNAADLFDERGFLLTLEARDELLRRVALVELLTDGAASEDDDFASEQLRLLTAKPAPSLMDTLGSGVLLEGLKPPKSLAAWGLVPIADAPAGDARSIHDVALAIHERLTASPEADAEGCELQFYSLRDLALE